jgi:hypothetical protein
MRGFRFEARMSTKRLIHAGVSKDEALEFFPLCRACCDKILPRPKEQSMLVQHPGLLGSAAIIVTFLLGIVILAHWSVYNIYSLGLLLGIDLVFAGAAWIAVAAIDRQFQPNEAGK